uniref:Uncharacterized protein n=1 Tax=Globodera rostochiensis TaxID=31243 RepID=A0A914HPK9_GLORO
MTRKSTNAKNRHGTAQHWNAPTNMYVRIAFALHDLFTIFFSLYARQPTPLSLFCPHISPDESTSVYPIR